MRNTNYLYKWTLGILVIITACSAWRIGLSQDSTIYTLRSLATIHQGYGGRVSWNRTTHATYGTPQRGGVIAYDRLNAGQTSWEIWLTTQAGAGNAKITGDGITALPSSGTRNYGNPDWHPVDGNYMAIVALGEEVDMTHLDTDGEAYHPGAGLYADLYILMAGGAASWIIHDAGDYDHDEYHAGTRKGVLHPHFNLDGTKIVFGKYYENGPDTQDYLKLAIGSFAWNEGTPELSGVTEYDGPGGPGTDVMMEPHGWYSADCMYVTVGSSDQDENELYTFCVSTQTWTRLTTDGYWDEHAHALPNGNGYMYLHFLTNSSPRYNEYFINDQNGIRQITNLNTQYPLNYWAVSDYDWDATGWLAVAYIYAVLKAPPYTETPGIYLLNFGPNLIGVSIIGGTIQ